MTSTSMRTQRGRMTPLAGTSCAVTPGSSIEAPKYSLDTNEFWATTYPKQVHLLPAAPM